MSSKEASSVKRSGESKTTMSGSPSKRIRTAPPDLTVLLGKDEKRVEAYSQILAHRSVYIDNLLASGMKESQTMTIRFPEIEEDDWTKMQGLLEDPSWFHILTFQEAKKLVHFYDKYEFDQGKLLCALVIERELEICSDEKLFLEICTCADELGMESVFKRCVAVIKTFLTDYDGDPTKCSSNGLYLSDPRGVAPFVAKDESLLALAFADKDGVLSPLWPEYFYFRKKYGYSTPPRWFQSSLSRPVMNTS